MQRRRNLKGFMWREGDHAERKLWGSDVKALRDLARSVIGNGVELEDFPRKPHRLRTVLLLDRRTSAELGEVPAVGLLPKHRAIPQYVRRYLGKVGREFCLELAVLLVDRGEVPGEIERLAGERAEVPIFLHLGVIDIPLAADPLHQYVRLFGRWVTAEFVSYLHGFILRESTLAPSI